MFGVNPTPKPASPLGQVMAYNRLIDRWLPYLAPPETQFVVYLIRHTYGYQHERVRATRSQMAEGTRSLKPCGLPFRTLNRVLASLVARGVVLMAPAGNGLNTYEINLEWEPEMSLAVPKRLKGEPPTRDLFPGDDVPERHTSCANLAHGMCQSGTPLKENPFKGIPRTDSAAQGRRDRFGFEELGEEAPSPARPPVAARFRSRPAAPASTRTPSTPAPATPAPITPAPATAAEAIAAVTASKPARKTPVKVFTNDSCWIDAWRETYPGIPVINFIPKHRAMMANLRKRLETHTGLDWFDFLGWSVRNWRHVIATKFAWMKQKEPPAYPDVHFLCSSRFSQLFLEAYAGRLERDRHLLARGEEALRLRLAAEGKSNDEILLEIGRYRMTQEEREKLDKARAHLEAEARATIAERERLQRQRMAPPPPAPPPPAPGERVRLFPHVPINHGKNPYENPDAAHVEVFEFAPWEDE